MKFSLAQLGRHLETRASVEEISQVLSAIGLEVEAVTDLGKTLAAFKIVEVLEAKQHPNADRLRVCRVNTGEKILQIVCGAPNARGGMKAVLALPGSFVPGLGIEIKTGKIRGEVSEGMLASARELGLGEEHDGILDLPAEAPVGAVYAEWALLNDPVIEIAVTPNRGDALSVRGIARDLAAAGLGNLKPLSFPSIPLKGPATLSWEIAPETSEACPFIIGRSVTGVKNGPSPLWLQKYLQTHGLNPVNCLVDLTNFLTLDLGRPFHVFDQDKLTGPTLFIRPANQSGQSETLLTLQNKEITLSEQDVVIADSTRVLSLAGVIGGEASKCTEETRNIFIECAYFTPKAVAGNGQRHLIPSDARARFERGIDPDLIRPGLDLLTDLILTLCGGQAGEVSSAGNLPSEKRTAAFRFSALKQTVGEAVSPDEAVCILQNLGFLLQERTADRAAFTVPGHRNDIASPEAEFAFAPEAVAALGNELPDFAQKARQIAAEQDLLEEITRIKGLDAIAPLALPALRPNENLTGENSEKTRSDQAASVAARRLLCAAGYTECVTFSFTSTEKAKFFGEAPEELRLLNPASADLNQLRPTPLVTLIGVAAKNAALSYPDQLIFEIGPAFEKPEAAPENFSLPTERDLQVIAALQTGHSLRQWQGKPEKVNFFTLKAHAVALLGLFGLNPESLSFERPAGKFYHPGQSALIRQGKTLLGQLGLLHPEIIRAFDLPASAGAFEIFTDALPPPKHRAKSSLKLSALQPVRRDFAFIVDENLPAADLLRVIKLADRTLITEVNLFDCYQGELLPAFKKSLGIEVTLQPFNQTLTDAEIEALSQKLILEAERKCGARLRQAAPLQENHGDSAK